MPPEISLFSTPMDGEPEVLAGKFDDIHLGSDIPSYHLEPAPVFEDLPFDVFEESTPLAPAPYRLAALDPFGAFDDIPCSRYEPSTSDLPISSEFDSLPPVQPILASELEDWLLTNKLLVNDIATALKNNAGITTLLKLLQTERAVVEAALKEVKVVQRKKFWNVIDTTIKSLLLCTGAAISIVQPIDSSSSSAITKLQAEIIAKDNQIEELKARIADLMPKPADPTVAKASVPAVACPSVAKPAAPAVAKAARPYPPTSMYDLLPPAPSHPVVHDATWSCRMCKSSNITKSDLDSCEACFTLKVETNWRCMNCRAVNQKTHSSCRSCGTPQPVEEKESVFGVFGALPVAAASLGSGRPKYGTTSFGTPCGSSGPFSRPGPKSGASYLFDPSEPKSAFGGLPYDPFADPPPPASGYGHGYGDMSSYRGFGGGAKAAAKASGRAGYLGPIVPVPPDDDGSPPARYTFGGFGEPAKPLAYGSSRAVPVKTRSFVDFCAPKISIREFLDSTVHLEFLNPLQMENLKKLDTSTLNRHQILQWFKALGFPMDQVTTDIYSSELPAGFRQRLKEIQDRAKLK